MSKNSDYKSYVEILKEKELKTKYGDLLLSIEWREKRAKIIKRDQNKCRRCGITIIGKKVISTRKDATKEKKEVWLEVHHTCYRLNRLPWEYPDKFLVTLCSECHFGLHEYKTVPILRMVGGKLVEVPKVERCSRCNGRGVIRAYKHIANGICFECNGNRFKNINLLNIKYFIDKLNNTTATDVMNDNNINDQPSFLNAED